LLLRKLVAAVCQRPKSPFNAVAVPVTTRQQSSAARRALLPGEYETDWNCGEKPQMYLPCKKIVGFGQVIEQMVCHPPDRFVRRIQSIAALGDAWSPVPRQPGTSQL